MRTPSTVLLVTAAILAVVVAAELRFGTVPSDASVVPASSRPKAADPLPAPSLVLVAPLDALTETVERPLFLPDRRPLPAEAFTPPTTPQPKAAADRTVSGLVLSAVVMVGDERLAFIRDPSTGQVRRLAAGDRIGQWQLEKIHSDSVSLSDGSRREVIPLRTFQPAPAAARARAARQRAKQRAKRRTGESIAQGRSKATPAGDTGTSRGAQPAKTSNQ